MGSGLVQMDRTEVLPDFGFGLKGRRTGRGQHRGLVRAVGIVSATAARSQGFSDFLVHRGQGVGAPREVPGRRRLQTEEGSRKGGRGAAKARQQAGDRSRGEPRRLPQLRGGLRVEFRPRIIT